ncbi:MAG TPA: serine hydrolase domain-containing protein [Anaerolineales bacterium]|nr:serine hydrolase domain-containing protein [Anaerolineales bacterium]
MKTISGQTLTEIQQFASDSYSGTLLMAQGGRVLLNVGYGWADGESTQPIVPSTRFWIASISKQFTAAAILRLAELQLLSVSDPIGRFFTSVPDDKVHITLHQLLTHTAGLRQNYAADGITERQEAVEAILSQPLARAPGAGFGYSNDAYNLLAAVIEGVAGQTFEACLEQLILQPAKLENTGFWGGSGHETVAEIHGEVEPSVRQANWGFRGAVGMFSTTGDLFCWYEALQTEAVLSATSRGRLMEAQVQLDQNESAGYGWFITRTEKGKTTLWTRGTEGFGHNAILLAMPEEELVIAAASNAGNIEGLAASRTLVEQLDRMLQGGSG